MGEDENHSHGESNCLTTLEALEVLSNPFSIIHNIHKLQKENKELIKLNKNILRSIDEHTMEKHKLEKKINGKR
jgi:hypothetical protein